MGSETIKRMLSIVEVAEILGVSSRWVRRAIAAKQIPHVRLGRLVKIEAADLEAFVAAHRS